MPPTTSLKSLDDLLSHVRQSYGDIEHQISEAVDSDIPIDLYLCQPPNNECQTLVTAGMSRFPMPNPPEGWEKRSRCELVLQAPPLNVFVGSMCFGNELKR